MEKYMKIGVAAVVLAAAFIVGAIFFAGDPKEGGAPEVQEMNLDVGAEKK